MPHATCHITRDMSHQVNEMALCLGGLMRQEIYDDKYGIDAWETEASSRCFVHIANSLQWKTMTGKRFPRRPINEKDYTSAGYPWFDYYDDKNGLLEGSEILASLDSVKMTSTKKAKSKPSKITMYGEQTITLGSEDSGIKDGQW